MLSILFVNCCEVECVNFEFQNHGFRLWFRVVTQNPKSFKAIAAMSLNRVIGSDGKIPWHLPEDFRWFKQMTTGHVIVMGRKTFESIGKALPNRETIVLSRSGFSHPDVRTVASLAELDAAHESREIFICGGAEIYAQTLPLCSDLYLSVVKREVEGDAFFPPFEDRFELVGLVFDRPEFEVRHYRNRNL
jgi:dihydrofolate reductase